MPDQRIHLGKEGEDLAVAFLKKKGYRILERNFRNKWGEVDIIAQDREVICFIEVKLRTTTAFGLSIEAISKSKQNKLIRMALGYLQTKKMDDVFARFDVVTIDHNDQEKIVDLITNAFEIEGNIF